MIDNFDIIHGLLEFKDEDTFYDLQIIRRGKDHPDLPSANRTIKSYYICKLESLPAIKEEVIKLCELFGARAYINLAPKSLRKVTLLQMQCLAKRLYDDDIKKVWKTWGSCAGTVKSDNPAWVVDLDDCNVHEKPQILCEVKDYINSLEPHGDKIKAVIPTKSGLHLITSPFRLDMFKERFQNIDVHKNNPTVLYIP